MLGNIWWYWHVVVCTMIDPVSTTIFSKILELLLGLNYDVVDSFVASAQCTKLISKQLHIMTTSTGPCLL